MPRHAARTSAGERAHLNIKTGDRTIPEWVRRALLAAPGIARLLRLREDAKNFDDPFAFVDVALRELQVQLDLPPFEEEKIPATGPVVITSNHPYGGLDGLMVMATVGRRRRDLRILVNPELAQLDGIGSLMIAVDPFGGPQAKRANAVGMRKALRWVEDGGALMIFPAGEVSHLQLRTLSVCDPPWSTTAARLIRMSGAPVVPMYFGGANSALFQLAGVLHPRLRTLLLPHELGNKLGARVPVRLGNPLPPAKLAAFETDAELAAHLRLKTYLLKGAPAAPLPQAPLKPAPGRSLEPLAPAIDPERLSCEIETLPAEMLFVSSGRLQVYCAPTSRIPWTLQELGRLRELTFRGVGEGTGRSIDIDVFDDYYEHLFIWNTETREIVGAYRLGRTDEISRRFGKRGLYTSTLFDYNELFIKLLGPALELGRSFVRLEYQKSFAPLMLLWKGIAEYVSRQPRYCRLIGPVSISNEYRPLSRDLLVSFLRKRNFTSLAPTVVRPKTPFRGRFSLRSLGGHKTLGDIETLSSIVAELEPDGKGAPVLLRQYLKLGGRMLGFNVDPDFGNALDCLVLIDLRKTNPRVLRRYMSDAGWERFAQAHRRLRVRSSAAG